MSALTQQLMGHIESGEMSGRLWLYTNYHCNLSCTYCLTESSPQVAPRRLGRSRMVDLSKQAAALGFTGIGLTGGEPFLEPDMVDSILRVYSEKQQGRSPARLRPEVVDSILKA